MKRGSTDDPFAEEPEEEVDNEEGRPSETETAVPDPEDASSTARDTGESPSREVQRQSLPFIHARDGVKDGRTQRPVFLRDHVENGIEELVDRMETELGEDVYKTDVTEAAMVVAQEHPELVLETLEEWGYGWD